MNGIPPPSGEDGCHLHPVCLTCPFDACIYDGEAIVELKSKKRDARNEEIRRLAESGMTANEAMDRFGISRRTFHRIRSGKQ